MSTTLTFEGDNAPVDLADPEVPIDLSDDPHTLLFHATKKLGDRLTKDHNAGVVAAIQLAGDGVIPTNMKFDQLLKLYGLLRILEVS